MVGVGLRPGGGVGEGLGGAGTDRVLDELAVGGAGGRVAQHRLAHHLELGEDVAAGRAGGGDLPARDVAGDAAAAAAVVAVAVVEPLGRALGRLAHRRRGFLLEVARGAGAAGLAGAVVGVEAEHVVVLVGGQVLLRLGVLALGERLALEVGLVAARGLRGGLLLAGPGVGLGALAGLGLGAGLARARRGGGRGGGARRAGGLGGAAAGVDGAAPGGLRGDLADRRGRGHGGRELAVPAGRAAGLADHVELAEHRVVLEHEQRRVAREHRVLAREVDDLGARRVALAGGQLVDLEAGPGAREVGVDAGVAGRGRLEVDLEPVRDDLSRRTGGAQLDGAVDRAAELADQEDGVAGAQRGEVLRVHVLHAAREGELDVAGDRDLAAQAELADQAAEVVLGVGAQEVAAGAAGEGVEEQEVGAGAEGDGLHAGAGEGSLEVAQELVGGELAGGGGAVAEVDDDALGGGLRVDAGVGAVEGLGGGAHHAADVGGAGEDLLVEEGVGGGHRLGRGGQAAGGDVAGRVAREHGHAVVLAERGGHRLHDRAGHGPQLGGDAVRAVEDEGVVDRAGAGGQLEVRLHGEHEVGLVVAVEEGLGVLALLAGVDGDVDAEVVDRAEALLVGGQLEAVGELAAVELGHRRGDAGEAVGRDGALVDRDGEREVADLLAGGAAARAGDRVAVAQGVADGREHLGVREADLPLAAPGDREDLHLEDVALLPLEQGRVARDGGVDDLAEDVAGALLLQHLGVHPRVADQQREAGDRGVGGQREAVGALEHLAGLVVERLLDLRAGDAAGDRDGHLLVDDREPELLVAGAGAAGGEAADAGRDGVGHGGGDLEGARPGGVLERAQADLGHDRCGGLAGHLGGELGGERGLDVGAGGEGDLLAGALEGGGAVDDVVAATVAAGEGAGLAAGDDEGVCAGPQGQRGLAGGDDRDELAAGEVELAGAGAGEGEPGVLVEAEEGAVAELELGHGAARDQQDLAAAELGAGAEECPFGQVLGAHAGGAVDGGELGDGVGDLRVDDRLGGDGLAVGSCGPRGTGGASGGPRVAGGDEGQGEATGEGASRLQHGGRSGRRENASSRAIDLPAR